MRRGEIWWASLHEPRGSGPEYRRPVLIVQSNEFNESAIRTSVCAAMLITLDEQRLTEEVGRLSADALRDVEAGMRLVLAL
jgi:mRNA interferase MazF